MIPTANVVPPNPRAVFARLRMATAAIAWCVSIAAVAVGCAPDPCEPSDDRVVTIGQGVGGAFEEYADGEGVALSIAPQGGFGISIVLQTSGIAASDDARVDVNMATEIAGDETGDFLLEGAPLLCRSDGAGGSISGLVVGFDPDEFRSNDDLLALDGESVDLVVVIHEEGQDTESRKTVTVQVGQ